MFLRRLLKRTVGRRLSSVLLLALSLGAAVSFSAHARPQRVVSLNLCTDLLLNLVAEPAQVAGFSPFAINPAYSAIAANVDRSRVHNGSAEAVIFLQPDLIIAPLHMQGTARLLERLGYKVARLELPYSLSDISGTLVAVGELLGQRERAMQVDADFSAARAAAANTLSQQRALVIGPNRYVTGSKEFRSDVLAVAGLSSAAPFERSGSISLEQLILAAPDVLIIDDSTTNQHSLAQSFKRHPALQKMAAIKSAKQFAVRSSDWICATPYIANIWQQLANAGGTQ